MWLATPAASLIMAIFIVSLLVRAGYHRDSDGVLSRQRLASVFILSASAYTFCILATAQIFFDHPSYAVLVDKGFGNDRLAWISVGVITDSIWRIWDEFRHR